MSIDSIESLKKAIEGKHNYEVIVFGGMELVVGYVKHLIEYLEGGKSG